MIEKKRIGRPPPNWLINLPMGVYNLDQLIIHAGGISKSSIIKTFKKYDVKPTYEKRDRFIIVYYQWEGFKK